MKVLHVVATGNRRGGELFAAALVKSLGALGVEQRVVVLRSDGRPAVPFAAKTLICAPGRSLPGIRMSPRRLRTLRRAMRSFRPDVVQAHGGEALKYSIAATLGDGRRVVYRRIGDAGQLQGSRMRERAHAALMRRAARVVAVAEVLRAELVTRLALSPARVVTIPNAVDLAEMAPSRTRSEVRAELGIGDDACVVLSVGAMTWEKDPVAVVRAAADAGARSPSLVHVIAGDGPLRRQVEAEVGRLGLDGRAHLLGVRDDVGDLLGASDVLLLASRTEGMPASLIEAGMAGIPVAAYAISGVPEVVEDGVTGRLAPPGDAAALADALVELARDAHRRRDMGRAAAERCRRRFDIGVVAPRYLEVYEDVVRRAGAFAEPSGVAG